MAEKSIQPLRAESNDRIQMIAFGPTHTFPVDLNGGNVVGPEDIREIADRLTDIGNDLLICLRLAKATLAQSEYDECPREHDAFPNALEGVEFVADFARALRAQSQLTPREKSNGHH